MPQEEYPVKGINFLSKLCILFYIRLPKITLFPAKHLSKTTISPRSEKCYPTLHSAFLNNIVNFLIQVENCIFILYSSFLFDTVVRDMRSSIFSHGFNMHHLDFHFQCELVRKISYVRRSVYVYCCLGDRVGFALLESYLWGG